jgi:hypothetical protein
LGHIAIKGGVPLFLPIHDCYFLARLSEDYHCPQRRTKFFKEGSAIDDQPVLRLPSHPLHDFRGAFHITASRAAR